MKQLKITIFGLLFLLFGATMFWACSSEEELTTDTKSNLRTFVPEELEELRAIVAAFYEEEVTFDIGRTATVSEEEARYDCTEIIIDSDTRARGYLVSDHTTGEFLYFADVDRTSYVLKTLDIVYAERETIMDIDHHPDYYNLGEFDFYQIAVDGPRITLPPGGRFWGWSCGSSYYLPGEGCVRTCAYYVLGTLMYSDIYQNNDLPGSNPKKNTIADAC